jgi:hypothetical protein
MKAGVLVHPGPPYASWPPANFYEKALFVKVDVATALW